MVCNILIESRVHDIGNVYGSNVVEKHEKPHCDDGDRETVTDKKNCFVLERVADGDSGNDEAGVREHHSPPTQVEVDSPRVDDLRYCISLGEESCTNKSTYSHKGNHEEPHCQNPEEQRSDQGHCSKQSRVDKTISLQIEIIGKSIGHTNQR